MRKQLHLHIFSRRLWVRIILPHSHSCTQHLWVVTLWISLSIFYKLALPFTGTAGWAGGIYNKKNYCIVVWPTGTKDRWGILNRPLCDKILNFLPGFHLEKSKCKCNDTKVFELQNSLNVGDIVCQNCLLMFKQPKNNFYLAFTVPSPTFKCIFFCNIGKNTWNPSSAFDEIPLTTDVWMIKSHFGDNPSSTDWFQTTESQCL